MTIAILRQVIATHNARAENSVQSQNASRVQAEAQSNRGNQTNSSVQPQSPVIRVEDLNPSSSTEQEKKEKERNTPQNLSTALQQVADGTGVEFEIIRELFSGSPTKEKTLADKIKEASTAAFTGTIKSPETIRGQLVVGSAQTPDGKQAFILEDNSIVTQKDLVDRKTALVALETLSITASDASPVDKLLKLVDSGVDAAVASELITKVQGGNAEVLVSLVVSAATASNLSDTQKLTTAGTLAAEFLSVNGFIEADQAADVKSGLQALAVVLDPNATDEQKGIAIGNALTENLSTTFEGPVSAPISIGGIKVVGSAIVEDGEPGFLLEDGTVVSQQSLNIRSYALNALQAAAVLTSNASDADKVIALGKIGFDVVSAKNMVSKGPSGGIAAAFSAISLARNFNEMDSFQKAVSILQTSQLTVNVLESAGLVSTSSASTVGSILGGATGVAGIALGVDQAIDVFEVVDDIPRSKAPAIGALGVGVAGASIGAGVGAAYGAYVGSYVFPVVGTAVGFLVGAAAGFLAGSFGSGKSTAQKIRDGWRDAMEQMGIATKIDGSHHLELADGTLYNVGRDGGSKLINLDGTERHTFDVDWSNPLATESVPDAHLFAFATGLDPSNSGFGAFDGVTAQALNAATSNATNRASVQENIQFMLAKAGIDERQLGFRVETLRATNKISEQEYQVYLSRINEIYGTRFAPVDKTQATKNLMTIFAAKGSDISQPELAILQTLMNPEQLTANQAQLDKRLALHIQNQQIAALEAQKLAA